MDSLKSNFTFEILHQEKLVKAMNLLYTIVLLERERESRYIAEMHICWRFYTLVTASMFVHIEKLIGQNMCIVQINSRTNPHTHIHMHTQKVHLQSFGKPVLFREQNKFFRTCLCIYLAIAIFSICLFVCLLVWVLCILISFWRNWPLGTRTEKKEYKWKYAQKNHNSTNVLYCK